MKGPDIECATIMALPPATQSAVFGAGLGVLQPCEWVSAYNL